MSLDAWYWGELRSALDKPDLERGWQVLASWPVPYERGEGSDPCETWRRACAYWGQEFLRRWPDMAGNFYASAWMFEYYLHTPVPEQDAAEGPFPEDHPSHRPLVSEAGGATLRGIGRRPLDMDHAPRRGGWGEQEEDGQEGLAGMFMRGEWDTNAYVSEEGVACLGVRLGPGTWWEALWTTRGGVPRMTLARLGPTHTFIGAEECAVAGRKLQRLGKEIELVANSGTQEVPELAWPEDLRLKVLSDAGPALPILIFEHQTSAWARVPLSHFPPLIAEEPEPEDDD
jgi:hypothetical protein